MRLFDPAVVYMHRFYASSIFVLFFILFSLISIAYTNIFDDVYAYNMVAYKDALSNWMHAKGCQRYCAYAKVLSVMPSVDNYTDASKNLTVLAAVEELHNDFTLHGECDDDYIFDDSSFSGAITLNYSYRNTTLNYSTYPITSFGPIHIVVPNNFFEYNNTTGYEILTVSINGVSTFVYTVEDREIVNGSCEVVETRTEEYPVHLSSVQTFTVESGAPYFFLIRPVLKEQLIYDNRYDNLIFSKRRLMNFSIYVDNSSMVSSMRALNLFVNETEFGLKYIHSNSLLSGNNENETLSIYEGNFLPYLLMPENESFRYSYLVNSSYTAIGKHTLSLVVYDTFLNNFSYSSTVFSKHISVNNTVSAGLRPTSNFYPSISIMPPLSIPDALLPMFALISILVLFSAYYIYH